MHKDLTKFAALGVPVITLVGLAYLLGYWTRFGINPLEYIGFGDVLRLAILPMFFVISSGLVGIIFGQAAAIPKDKAGLDKAVKDGKRYHSRRWWVLGSGTVVIGAAVAFVPDPFQWMVAALALGAMLSPFSSAGLLVSALPNTLLRISLYTILTVMVPLGFAHGRLNAYLLTKDLRSTSIDVARLPAELNLKWTKDRPLSFGGRLGDYLAVYESASGYLVLVQADSVPALAIQSR